MSDFLAAFMKNDRGLLLPTRTARTHARSHTHTHTHTLIERGAGAAGHRVPRDQRGLRCGRPGQHAGAARNYYLYYNI